MTTYEVCAIYADGSRIKLRGIEAEAYAHEYYAHLMQKPDIAELRLDLCDGSRGVTLKQWSADPAKTVCPDCLNTGWICTECGDVLTDCQCEVGESDACECTRCQSHQ